MIQLYLLINAFSYLLFALWCLVKPDTTGKSLGYGFLNPSGKVEYLTVYTGMELGFALFFTLCAFYPALRLSGLLFAACLYLGLMILRPLAAIAQEGRIEKITYIVGGLEWLLGVWGIALLITELKKTQLL